MTSFFKLLHFLYHIFSLSMGQGSFKISIFFRCLMQSYSWKNGLRAYYVELRTDLKFTEMAITKWYIIETRINFMKQISFFCRNHRQFADRAMSSSWMNSELTRQIFSSEFATENRDSDFFYSLSAVLERFWLFSVMHAFKIFEMKMLEDPLILLNGSETGQSEAATITSCDHVTVVTLSHWL